VGERRRCADEQTAGNPRCRTEKRNSAGVPAGTRFPEIIETGSAAASVPTSVAQVSAADAASAPAAIAYQAGDGSNRCPSAAAAYTPPLARPERSHARNQYRPPGPRVPPSGAGRASRERLRREKCEKQCAPDPAGGNANRAHDRGGNGAASRKRAGVPRNERDNNGEKPAYQRPRQHVSQLC